MSLNNRRYLPYFLIVVILSAVYIPLILQQSDFRTDDYYLLTIIKQQGVISPFDGVQYSYYSAFRLIPMLSLFVDYNIYGPNPLGFYLFNLALHLATVLLFFLLLKLLFRQFFDYGGELLPFLLALAVGLHADLFYNVLWICNRTEGLLLFFYLGAVYSWLRYFAERRKYWYLIGLLSFLLALLSKEQAIHLPLMFLLLGRIAMEKRDRASWRRLLLAAAPIAALAGVVLLLRMVYDPGALFLTSTISPKKLFSLIGINLIAFHPTLAMPLFIYFTEHILVAAAVALILVCVGLLGFYRIKRSTKRIVIALLIAIAIISFPRALYQVFPRVNSIQVVFLLMTMGVLLLRVRPRIMFVLAIVFILGQTAGMLYELKVWRIETSNDRYIRLLNSEEDDGHASYTLLTHYHDHARYTLFFLREGDFGIDSTVQITPLIYARRYGSHNGDEFQVVQHGTRFEFRSNEPRAVFLSSPTIPLIPDMTVAVFDRAEGYGYKEAKVVIGKPQENTRYLIERNDAFEIVSLTDPRD
ncbi:MAG: hypothetical protein WAV84_01055 [Bacteroidota bacterium]